jgi:hypothetical protein
MYSNFKDNVLISHMLSFRLLGLQLGVDLEGSFSVNGEVMIVQRLFTGYLCLAALVLVRHWQFRSFQISIFLQLLCGLYFSLEEL